MTQQEAEVWLAIFISQYNDYNLEAIYQKFLPDVIINPPDLYLWDPYIPIKNLTMYTVELETFNNDFFWQITSTTWVYNITITESMVIMEEPRTYNYHQIPIGQFFNLTDETL